MNMKRRASVNLKSFTLAAAVFFAVVAAFWPSCTALAQVNFPPGEIYFSPETSLEEKFTGFLARAEGAIFMSASAFDSTKIADALIDARTRRMLPVKMVIYKPAAANNLLVDKLMNYGVQVVLAENPAGFEHDFCIVDYDCVYFSSAPFAYSSMNQNYNYAMIVSNDENFAKNFHYEFVEMFEGHYFGSASPQNTQYPTLNFNGTIVETAFLPEDNADNKIASLIAKSNSSVRVMSSEFKNSLLTDNILGKKNYLTEIKCLFEYGSQNVSRTEYETYRRTGVYAIQNKTFPKIESSFLIIDDKYLVLFGRNKSILNTTTADSFLLTINSTQIAATFKAYYDSIWNKNTVGIFLTGQVQNSENKLPLEGAKVSCPTQALATYSDYLGWYEFKGDMPDNFLTLAEREYYYSKELIFSKKSGVRLDFLLSPIISYNSLSGFILDSDTRNPIPGCGLAAISIDTASGVRTIVRTSTNEKGFFTFRAVPQGQVDLEITHPNYLTRIEKALTISAGQPVSLSDPLYLTPNYVITAYPNPVFEDNLFINIKDSAAGGEIPRVTIKQFNYVEVPVDMRIVATVDLKNVYVGNYVIKKGYYGAARINVNGGSAYKDVTIDFLEAYKNYTYAAPGISGRAGTTVRFAAGAVGKSGLIAIQRAAGAENPDGELAPVGDQDALAIDFSRNFALAPGAGGRLEIVVAAADYQASCAGGKGGRPSIYRYNGNTGGWDFMESSADERECASGSREVVLGAAITGGGTYRVMGDRVPPRVEAKTFDGGVLTVRLVDAGSGVSKNGAAIVCEKAVEAAEYVRFEGRSGNAATYSISRASELAGIGARLVLNDRAGNFTALPLSAVLRQAAGDASRRVTVYPNPCRSYAKFRIAAPAGDYVSITVYDSSGDRVAEVCEERRTTGAGDEVVFSVAGSGIRKGNTTLFYRARFSSGSECSGKFSILN